MNKRPKPARGEAFGILNPYGDLWTFETFGTEDAARQYVAAFWRNIQGGGDLARFKVIPVRVTVSAKLIPRPRDALNPTSGRTT